MTETRNEIIWTPSIKPLRADFRGRVTRAEKTLTSIKNRDGLYADEHRAMIALYRDILSVIEDHDARRRATFS